MSSSKPPLLENATRDLESKHRQLTALLMQKQAMDKQVREVRRQTRPLERQAGLLRYPHPRHVVRSRLQQRPVVLTWGFR